MRKDEMDKAKGKGESRVKRRRVIESDEDGEEEGLSEEADGEREALQSGKDFTVSLQSIF